MGNESSSAVVEDEKQFLEGLHGMSLESPDFDERVNAGTTAANCQPKHTREEEERMARMVAQAAEGGGGQGQAQQQHMQQQHMEQKQMGYVAMAQAGYQELVNAIIRPPRAEYKEESLGPPAFAFCGRRFSRTDFAIRTKRGLDLQCSHWEPVERISDRIPVVIYMHGNSSARVEVLPQLSYLLSLGLAVFSFDFAGSGKSDGDYVSLGYYEREDLMCVIAHLRATNVVSTIALWGRSMGAATSLMHGDRDPSIACMVLDSSFADLTQLCEEMVEKAKEQGITVPSVITSIAIRMLRGSVKKQAEFDIRDISPISHADKSFIPALFVHGEHDDFIHKRHSEAVHARYAGDKNLIIVEGDHNSPRPKFMFDSVSIFLQTCLQIPNSWALKTLPGMNLMAPPWMYPGTPDAISDLLSAGPASTRRGRPAAADDEGVAMTAAVEISEEMGMTMERQKQIQASLFKMLGQADDDDEDGVEDEDEAGVYRHSGDEEDSGVGVGNGMAPTTADPMAEPAASAVPTKELLDLR